MTNNPTPSVLIACPMSYKLVNGEPWFTGDKWMSQVLAQDYLKFRVFVLGHMLKPEMSDAIFMACMNKPEIAKKGIEVVIRSVADREAPDDRYKRDEMRYQKFALLRNMVLEYALEPVNRQETCDLCGGNGVVIGRVFTDPRFNPNDSESRCRGCKGKGIVIIEDVEQVEGFDYLVSIDSDVMVHPDMVSRLVSYMQVNGDVGMCGIPVNNMRRKGGMFEYPNAIFNFGFYSNKGDRPETTKYRQVGRNENEPFPLGTYFPVDYTGAACIIRMDMLKKHPDVRYGSIPQQKSEDMYFSWQIKNAGYQIMMDTGQVTLHMMEPGVWKQDMPFFYAKRIV